MNERHRLIAVILDRREVTSQQQLVELLSEQGVAVTQATVSRDLDRLGAVRVRRNGHMVYALPEGDEPIDPQELLRQVLGAVLLDRGVVNLCILKTKPGAGDAGRARLRPGRPDRGLRHDRRRRHDPADRPRARRSAPTSRRCAARCSSGGPCLSAGPLWSGRLAGGLDPRVLAYSQSLSVDGRLLPYDVRASKAHVRMLARQGIIPAADAAAIDEALDQVVLDEGATDEDVHSLIERQLVARLGETGKRVHAGRSRNDQVATAFRLCCRDAARDLVGTRGRAAGGAGRARRGPTARSCCRATRTCSARSRCRSATTCARTRGRSQRDVERLLAAGAAADVSPLGAGALAGSSLPLDPDAVGARARLRRPVRELASTPSSDRDFAVDLS